jgi:hypothetical protein
MDPQNQFCHNPVCPDRGQGGRVWMAMALAVPSRLWLGGVISPHRDRALITRLVQRVRACARSLAILVCVDGLGTYVRPFARFPGSCAYGVPWTAPASGGAGLAHRPSQQTVCPAARGQGSAPGGAWDDRSHRRSAGHHRRRKRHQYRLHRAAECHLSQRFGAFGAPGTCPCP